jgi:hypothetical protein
MLTEPMSRQERLACAAMLAGFVVLRLVGGRTLAFDLLDPEVLLNLRLAQQLQADLPMGELGQYWYTGAGANVGAGPLVMSLLYVPIGWFVESDFSSVRALSLIWATASALAMAGIGRQLLGRGGAAAGMAAALAMPPTWLAWSLGGVGNYWEGAVLTLVMAWATLRLVRGHDGWSLLVGGLGAFGAWFCVTTIPPAALLLGVVIVLKRPRALLWLGVGLLVGAVPWMTGLEPTASVASPVGGGEVGGVLKDLLGRPGDWLSVGVGSLLKTPMLAYRDLQGEDWAPGWLLAAAVPLVAASWLALSAVAAVVLGPEAGRRRLGVEDVPFGARVLVGAAVLSAIAEPIGLSAMGFAPEGLAVERIWTFVPRRAAIVWPVLALAWAAVGHWAWRWIPARIAVGALVLFGVAAQILLIQSAPPTPASFHPARYLLCPAEEPVFAERVCVGSLWEDQVAVLEALVQREDLQPWQARRAALLGFGSVERDEDVCELLGGQADGPALSGRTLAEWASWGVGASAAACGAQRAAEICGQTSAVEDCAEGVVFGSGFGAP